MATKTSHTFQLKGRTVKFESTFDGGNLRDVTQKKQQQFVLEGSFDSYEQPSSDKVFFHFRIINYPHQQPITLVLPNLALLGSIQQERRERYRPTYSLDGHTYHHVSPDSISVSNTEPYPSLTIKSVLKTPTIYFSFSFPYSYERYLNMIRDLHPSSHFHLRKEVLCYSSNLNLVYMITITSWDGQTSDNEHIANHNNGVIWPEKNLQPPRKLFDKPVILISGRVHPGETAASWAVEGIIRFLITDHPDAVMLRKYFFICIVPMLNPDGVIEGLYRYDTSGQNLNRYYLVSDHRQPSIYCMKHLIKHYGERKRLLYYFDFHGHPSYKGSFLYGNAHQNLAYQAQTELFARTMSLLCQTFQEKYCIFDRQQMNSKDKSDNHTKQGCARVYAFKISQILHSYTVELGLHGCDLGEEEFLVYKHEDYYREGVSILKALLETSGLKNTVKCWEERERIASDLLLREERFRKEDKNVTQKKKNVNQIIQGYWKPIRQNYFFRNLYSSHKTHKQLISESPTKPRGLSEHNSVQLDRNKREQFEGMVREKDDKLYTTMIFQEPKPKKITLKFRNRKMLFDNKSGDKKTKNLHKFSDTKIEEEDLFNDLNLREDKSSLTKIKLRSKSKIDKHIDEIKQIFKPQTNSMKQYNTRKVKKQKKFISFQ